METNPIKTAINKYNNRIKHNGEFIQRLQNEKKDLIEKISELNVRISQIDNQSSELIKETYQMQGAAEALSSLLGQLDYE